MTPQQKAISAFGHQLVKLTSTADAVARKHNLEFVHPRPTTAISEKIIECLDAFADAGRGRYANFVALGDPNLTQEEPIRKWWGEVAELILNEHYYGKQPQERAEGRARAVDEIISPATVLHFNDAGEAMQDVLSSSIQTQQTDIVQRYGRYHALTVVRWLAGVFSDLSLAAHTQNVGFFGVAEYFRTYTVDDSFLKTRKIWPLD